MEDDDDAKLKEEIEAELDKISISSLEKDDVDSDSKSETQSDDSDTDLDELPESVLHCIDIIKNKSKTAEELVLQDLEDTDVLSCTYGAVSNNHMHLRIELPTEYKEKLDQLTKILSEIEKEEFLRSKTCCGSSNSVPELGPHEHVDEYVLPDDGEIKFGYCEVEERCRQSFEVWQDKQKELEDQEKETLKAHRDREEKEFQEEEEKRHCWMEQFEVEKKKLENVQKQEQARMNDELHKEEKMWKEKFKQHEEFIRNLSLQMEEERTRFKDLQEKEKMRLLKMQHNAAVKIQTKYRAFVAYQKYGPIIKEQIENKKKKALEWKEKEAKIRQIEEEKRKRLEEEKKMEEKIQRQKEEERKRREKEYEEKKNIVRQEREQLQNKEKLKLKEDARQQIIISRSLKKGGHNATHSTIKNISKNKNETAKILGDEKSNKWEDVPLWIVKELNKRENSDKQLILKESIQVQFEASVSNQAVLAEFKMEEKKENLAKQQYPEKLVKQARKYENTDKKTELENPDVKEQMEENFQVQALICPIIVKKEKTMEAAVNENVTQETHKIILGHHQEINEVKNKKVQEIIKDNQYSKIQKVEKEEISEQMETLSEEDNILMISMKQELLPLKLENSEYVGEKVILQGKEIDLKSKETKENPKGSALKSDVIINASDVLINVEGKINKQNYDSDRYTHCDDLGGCNTPNSLLFKQANSPKSHSKEIPEECHGNRSGSGNVATCSAPEPALLSSIEGKRLAWIRSFKPWLEILEQNQQKKIVKKKRLVKCPANTLPPLNTLDILQYGSWNTLQQVTRVTFQDLPGCSLSTLAECTNLQFLSLRCCGLTSLHSLNNCKNLKYIDVQENKIETINCENLENLCILLLNKNQLTSMHGLDGCTNIQNLELSHNKITRIGGLESLKNLQRLVVDHNQLISTKGLYDTPTIIYLDCSHNHLTKLEGIENCGLLQILKLQGNYLSELPSLENHVLLRELYLDDNSISVVEVFSSYWLPLLQNLSMSQNSLTKITPLYHFVSLEKLDVSNNCLSDLTSAVQWFDACYSLRELSLSGNPLLQEINWRESLLKSLPALRILNGEMLTSCSESNIEEHCQPELGHFLVLCQSQIREFNLLIESCITGKGNIFTLDIAENLCHYFKKLMKLTNEYRFVHEHGDVGITRRGESEAQPNHVAPADADSILQNRVLQSCATKHKLDSPDVSEKWMDSGSSHFLLASSLCENTEGRNQEKIVDQKREDSKSSAVPTKRIPFMETTMTSYMLKNHPLKNHPNIEHYEKTVAAVVIQACWRGYVVRRQYLFSTKLRTASTGLLKYQPNSCLKHEMMLKKGKRENTVNIQEQKEKAAILIQAVWKGFLLRKKLTTALEAIKNEESEEEYEEIDLEDFTFDEAALEKEWLAFDSACFPSQTQLLPERQHWPKFSGTLNYDDTSSNLPTHPAQAWLYNEKENLFSSEHTQFNDRSEDRTLSWTAESKASRESLLKSVKEEKISEEWGFKDISTAQQMLKRAQKMKSKKLRKKLDATVRLALFKSNENKVSVTKSPVKVQSRRDGYSEDKEEEFINKDTVANEKLERNKEYMYPWLPTQVGVHETSSSRNMKCTRFLPQLDPEVLNGGRVQLVARLVSREDTDLDLFSMTSGNALSVKREKKSQAHRHSAGSSSISMKGILSPMITNTGPSKKERISFRDNPAQLSGGWGSGKKKAKTSN
ncbi:leucine-rich repeat and IQ domain-containing protein 1 isoform X1 [Sturnira hondurensis]|uniref:leucine-rich repeat and IQ domain-containing protein 1 isoform X1 n=1 Tax=Sturnira hondurensis TaxID=192404 RepID=UPI001879E98C|nr:leucine-rich repeat and IQ domain-containing protein 1 isoform X1 [Sturnira hondurensis]XP_036884333.1 leucine-rich repeat and IQ domain-containing protein 1 isoform X1 [Sturnira hondurensis]XP_036884335.1 leucine-rich repeat and IQ domain-containing protein 1 isoform X1 [Sturnira hondurensis]XP_036884336.1 leucine-rich repeat and IQ domain-containing protein 1 isoform X1 [Sturnira hondurensis]